MSPMQPLAISAHAVPAAVPSPGARRILLFLLALLLVQAPLWLNPGYFSHDELQWGAFSDRASLAQLPWVSWTDVATFQYRPLTFNLWLLLSHGLFDSPRAFHLVFVLLGTLNALSLYLWLRRRCGDPAAALGATLFALSPYAAYVHGWVATLADLLWVAALLGCLHAADRMHTRPGRTPLLMLCVAALATLGLLAKEAALSVPALLAVAWLASGCRRAWLLATLAAAVPAVLYLGLRAEVILFAPRADGAYGWTLTSVPLRYLEYLLYPFVPRVFEVANVLPTLAAPGAMLLAGLATASFLLALTLAAPRGRLLALWLLAALAALGPVLILESAANQYGYGFALVTGATCAWVLRRGGHLSRFLLLLPLLATVATGWQVQRTMYQVGSTQVTLYRDILAALEEPAAEPLRIWAGERNWMLRRLSHRVPAYRGVPIGDRVQAVDALSAASHRMHDDGSLQALDEAVPGTP